MSLLLDALKKAEKDKQQASAGEAGSAKAPDNNDDIELTLDEPSITDPQHAAASQEKVSDEPLAIEPVPELDKTRATSSTVSDEALHMLIYKTNKQFRHRQKLIWGSILAAAMSILILGGVYYYYVMLDEVESLERKHEIAMRLFESQAVTSTRKMPSTESEAMPVKSVSVTKNTQRAATAAPQTKRTQRPAQNKQTFSVTRSEKKNPVSDLLNTAWHAYGNGDYAVASDAYNKVLEREPRNRDALLGKAAIAVKKEDYIQAKAAYSILLRLDPRDQIAAAALSNLDEIAPDSFGEAKLKFMIQQQPEAPHLHFALGNFYAKQARWPESQSEYFSAWQGDSENADYAFNLAVSLDQLGKTDDAKRFYELSLNLSAGKNVSFSVEAVKDRLNKIAEK